MENGTTDSSLPQNNSLNLRVFVVNANLQQKLPFIRYQIKYFYHLNIFLQGENMKTQSFNQIMDDTIQNHWKNTLKMPVLARDEQGNYYLKDA